MSKLFPEGRDLYYEGDDPDGFARQIKAEFGFDPSADPHWGGAPVMVGPHGEDLEDPFGRVYLFRCPPEHLDAIYRSDRFPLGS
jgi:hypothetical protein